ncbi:acyl carrier protein [Nocardia colli]|uniref:acyl carrier protein n=1 Tax=Nocardia colli TaxID=2545717 RepID=UPI001CC360D0|nr:acyl carrier protein [Nocardia colli]
MTVDRLREWLVNQLAERLEVPPAQIDPSQDFESYGLDSRAGIQLSGRLEKLLELRLSPAILYEHDSIDALVDHLISTGERSESQ